MKLTNNIKTCIFVILVFTFLLSAFPIYADLPAGTVTIYGNNGSSLTSTRNVLLNLSYSSADGINACRWANDDESNLADYSYEVCTTIKPWILSETFGNKTVYFEILDGAGHTQQHNASIEYYFLQDFTAPTDPIVLDSLSSDIDYSNENTTISANWYNSTDDISTIFYYYRLMENESCYNNDCNWTSSGINTSITLGGLTLLEGTRYSFQIKSYVNERINSTNVSSNGTIIDLTRPDIPDVFSSTHPDQSKPYDSSVIRLNWTSTDPVNNGVSSGVYGYSYHLDQFAGSSPDNIIESRNYIKHSNLRKDSYNQTLKTNGTDAAFAVFSQIKSNFTVGDTIRVRFAVAEQNIDYSDDMKVEVYLTEIANDADILAFDQTGSRISTINNISQDIKYAHDMIRSNIYEVNLTITSAGDDSTNDYFIVIAGSTIDDDNNEDLAISRSFTYVDNSTRNYVCDEFNSCQENTSNLDYAIEVSTFDSGDDWEVVYDFVGDGVYYFHVKAQDVAGNWGYPAHYKVEVASGGASSVIYNPINNENFISEDPSLNISVSLAVSKNCSARIVVLHPDGSNYTSTINTIQSLSVFENITLELGTNTIYAFTNTSNGAIAHSSRINVLVSSDLNSSSNKTLRISYSGCAATPNPYICYVSEGSAYVGIASEVLGSISAPDVQTDTEFNSLKIFITKPFSLTKATNELANNKFMDQIAPSFGYDNKRGTSIIRNVLMYRDIFIGGDFYLSPGAYNLYIRKSGISTTGQKNITLTIDQ